ncbi:phosphatase PAP2 family protein [Dellaglioa sp. P0083]|uniref:phosphatase PAP2 family protein n=1 Tax=Dellaglioa kimchii TaxID=3344667 RepID=UPI0038D44380
MNNKNKLFGVAIMGSGLFAILTLLIVTKNNFIYGIDNDIAAIVRFHPTSQLDQVMQVISWLSSPMMIGLYSVILMIILYKLRSSVLAIWTGMTIMTGALLIKLIKSSVQRPRPMGHGSISGFSFPSGHTFGVTLFCLTITSIMLVEFKYSKQFLINCLLVIWIIMIMISRVYLQAHFPTDTIGAVLLAVIWIAIARVVYLKISNKLKLRAKK